MHASTNSPPNTVYAEPTQARPRLHSCVTAALEALKNLPESRLDKQAVWWAASCARGADTHGGVSPPCVVDS